jgi:hypothetical protein
MGLQIWLPLDGNLENKGLTDVTITANGTVSYANGKIGQCLSCNSATFLNIVGLTLNNEASILYWSKTAINGDMAWTLVSTSSDKRRI